MTILSIVHTIDQRAKEIFSAMTAVHEIDVTLRGAVLLTAVAAQTGASQTSLVEATGIDRSTVAEMVRRLMGKGFIARARTRKDARRYAVKLTPEGEKAVPTLQRIITETEDKLHAEFKGLNGLRIIPHPTLAE